MAQPTPDVDAADVERVLRRDFAPSDQRRARKLVDRLRRAAVGGGLPRVQLAALKIADGDTDRLDATVEGGWVDYRDLLTAAEYPAYHAVGWPQIDALTAEQRRAVIDADWRQYETWLRRA
jgi:hypothetical protein